MAARSVKKAREFDHAFPLGIVMGLTRLNPWEWDGVKVAAVRAAAQIRDGGAALLKYGFDQEEFAVLADAEKWEGVSEYIYAVELGVAAIRTVAGMEGGAGEEFEPGEFAAVAWLMRHQQVREEFLRIMNQDGSIYALEAAEGNG